MTKRIVVIFALCLSHAAVGVLSWFVTRSSMRQAQTLALIPSEATRDIGQSIDSQFARFIDDMEDYGKGGEASVRSDLLFTLQACEQLQPADQQLLTGVKGDEFGQRQFMELQCVRSLLETYFNDHSVNVLYFTTEKYHNLFMGKSREGNLSPERTLALRKRLHLLADAFFSLRKSSIQLPYSDLDVRFSFLEMLRDLASDDYAIHYKKSDCQIPFFNDQEGGLLFNVEKWLNSTNAQKSLPIEKFSRLYGEGKVEVLSPAFASYREQIIERIRQERSQLKSAKGDAQAALTQSYIDIENFFEFLSEFTKSSS